MAQNYTRQSTLSDGDTITASLFNDEYNQLVNAFTYSSTSASSTGHRHDGSAGQGGNIFKIGDLDFLNKIEVDSTNNRWGFYVEVSSAAVEQIRIQDGAIVPVTDSDIDLGTTSLRFKDTYTDTITTTGNVDVGGNLTVTGTTTFNGGTITMGDAATDNVVFGADVDSHIIPDDDDTYDLGSTTQQWRNLYIDGTANIDSLVADTADIDGGTIDGTVIGGTTPAAVSATTVSATGNITVGGTVDGRDVATDGTKLDGIESGATADQTAAEIRTLVDSATDSNVFTDADHTKLDGIEASADVTDTANVTAAGALMDSEVTNLDQVKAFDSSNYATAAQGTTADSALQNVVEDTTPQLGGNLNLNSNDITGTGNIDVTGSISADGLTVDGATDGTAVALLRADNNSVTKKNTLRFEDTDTTTQNDQQIGRIEFYSNDTDHTGVDAVIEAVSATNGLKELRFLTSDTADTPLSRLAISKIGDISFYDTDGTTASFVYDADAGLTINEAGADRDFRIESSQKANMFFLDASENRIGIGTGVPDTTLHVTSTTSGGVLTLESTSSNNSAGPNIVSYRSSSTPAADDNLGKIIYRGTNSAAEDVDYVSVESVLTSPTDGAEQGQYEIHTMVDGTSRNRLRINNSEIVINDAGRDLDFRVESDLQSHILFVDGGNNHVNIGSDTDYNGRLNVVTGDNTTTLALVSTDADANVGPKLVMRRDSASPADNDVAAKIEFDADNDAGSSRTYAFIQVELENVSDGAEDGLLDIRTLVDGSSRTRIKATGAETIINDSGRDLDFRVESDTNTHALFVQGSDGNVGIGDSAPDVALSVVTGQSNEQFHVQSPTPGMKFIDSNLTTRVFTIGGENGDVAIHADPNSASTDSHILMKADGSTIARFDGDGLKFGSDTAAANALDDYEEGTWTPVLEAATTNPTPSAPTVVNATYTKIGRTVHIQAYMTVTLTSIGSGGAQITGLPFTVGTGYAPVQFVHGTLILSNGGYFNDGSTKIIAVENNATSSIGYAGTGTKGLMLSGTYEVA